MMKISVVVATFNAEEKVERCLNSIVGQLNDNVELLIVDGGSNDNTQSIINKFRPSVTHFISEPDKGVYDAWNKAVLISKGNWIMFVGADDILVSGCIDRYIKLIDEGKVNDFHLLYGENFYVDESENPISRIGRNWSWDVFRNRNIVSHVGALHNRCIFDEVGLYDLTFKVCADYELLMRFKNNLRALFIQSPVALMQIGGMSYSFKALNEAYEIRRIYSDESNTLAFLNYILSIALFYRHRLKVFFRTCFADFHK